MLTLREIYLEIGEIFNFKYEKNLNGSHRVNTVIKNLVYPALYTSQEFGSNDICYYLANPEFSYQGYPNIRNSFSELMNPKETGNRYPVISFCNNIDINKMYMYYEKLIEQLKASDKDAVCRLTAFTDKIFDSNPAFHAKLKLLCHKTHEFLTWIILFSMFNSELSDKKFEQYIQETNEQMPELTISESGERHRLSARIIARKKHLDCITRIIFVLSAVQILLSFLPIVIPDNHKHHDAVTSSTFCLSLLALSLIVLSLRHYQSKLEQTYSNLQTYHNFMDDIPDNEIREQIENDSKYITIQPFDNTSHSNVARDRLRVFLAAAMIILLFASIAVSFSLGSFPILLTWVGITIIILIYIDRFYHDRIVRSRYDSLSCTDKPRPLRGIAKIYRWEYERTGFDIKDEYYETIVHVHSGTCYKHIFLMAQNQLKYNLFIYTTVLIYFTAVLLILETLTIFFDEAITDYLRIPDMANLNIIITTYLVVIGIYTITTLITSRNSYEYLSQLSYASRHAEEYPKWSEKFFLSLYARGIIRDIDWIRGVFTYNVSLFEKGQTAENIFPESDRMQFYHRHIALRPVALETLALSYVAAISLFVWHFHMIYLFLPITIFCILLYVFLYYYGLNALSRRRIINEIKHLSHETSDERTESLNYDTSASVQ